MKRGNDDKGRDRFLFSELRRKYEKRPWKETLKLVCRCMNEPVYAPKSSRVVLNCLERLSGALKVSSMSAVVSKLETIARQRGLGSHLSPTGTECFLTSDMFYVEVLLSEEGVQDVKLAQHKETPKSCGTLLNLLRLNKFKDFSVKLEHLNSLYDIPTDNESKIKIYTALQCLEKDLLKISNLPRPLRDRNLYVDTVLNGRIGKITERKEGNPMSIEYYLCPNDLLEEKSQADQCTLGHVALVKAWTSSSPQRLPMSSLISQPPEIDAHGLPVFTALGEDNSAVLPASFILKLTPPLPMTSSSVRKIEHLTGMAISESGLQWKPFLQLLLGTFLLENDCRDSSWEKGAAHFMMLPENRMHSYIVSGPTDGTVDLEGTLVFSIAFTHPAYVPKILDLLRHQSALNTLLTSCISAWKPSQEYVLDLHCEVVLQSDSNITISFVTDSDSLALLIINLENCHKISCKLFPPTLADPSLEEHLSQVLTKCMCLPVTMRALCRRLRKKPTLMGSLQVPSTRPGDGDTPETSPVSLEGNGLLPAPEEAGTVPGDASAAALP